MQLHHNKLRNFLIIVLLFSLTWPMMKPVHAAYPMLDNIRVALFIDQRGVVPAVTLSSLNGLHIGTRHPSGVNHWFDHAGNAPLRMSVDQYKLLVVETNDYVQASSALKNLNGMIGEAYIVTRMKNTQLNYRVYAGQFASESQAATARNQLAVSTLFKNDQIMMVGPHHLNAGTFATKQEAESYLNEISQNGLYGKLVYHENTQEQLVHSVWLGEAVNTIDLEQYRASALQMMPSLNLQSIDPNKPYLILRNQLPLNGGNQTIPHYFFNSTSQKVWISPENFTIQVAERNNRYYRGSMEITQYRNSLALINELPFEHYLYSVVSSELGAAWPMESLKAQAVAARTYALAMGMKYGIAHVSDTTFEQAYYGSAVEFTAAVSAVQATTGEIIVDKNGLITPYYYSNAGGMTADTSEIWGNSLNYIKSVPSPDQIAEKDKLIWNRVVLSDGTIGYVRSDFTRNTNQKNAAGLPILSGDGTRVNVRSAPYVSNESNPSIAQIFTGDRLILFEQTIESNAYRWIRGPFTAQEMKASIQQRSNTQINGNLTSIEVTARGPSGRVTQMKANGQIIAVNTPDSLRGAMNGLLSTRFDVEETGRYTIQGSSNQRHIPEHAGTLHVLRGNVGATPSQPQTLVSQEMFVMNGKAEVRLVTKDPQFRFVGLGFGHGIGMSQWGARELAEFVGYDYQQILKYYYQDVSIVKG